MLPDFNEYSYILESKNIKNTKVIDKCILFTDIEKSSELWRDNDDNMYKCILKHEDQIFKLCEKYSGFVIKSIGDAYMITFDSLLDAVNFSINIQHENIKTPIKVGNKNIKIRIGFSYGEVYEYKSDRQNKTMLDYFGNIVNTASRIESKISESGSFAFSYDNIDDDEKDKIIKLLNSKCKSYQILNYSDNCKLDKHRKRSGRLLSDTHNYICKPISKLNGVDNVIIYKIDFI